MKSSHYSPLPGIHQFLSISPLAQECPIQMQMTTGHLGRPNSLKPTFTPIRSTHHLVVQAERAPKPMALSPGIHLRGQGEGKRVPVRQLPPCPVVTGAESCGGGFRNRPGGPRISLAGGGHGGRLVSGRTVPRRAGQGPSLRPTLGPDGVGSVRRRRRRQVAERGWDRQRLVLVKGARSSLGSRRTQKHGLTKGVQPQNTERWEVGGRRVRSVFVSSVFYEKLSQRMWSDAKLALQGHLPYKLVERTQ